jgi:Holliday junction resolvase
LPNNNYVNGANFERKVKKHYEDLGYYVIRSAGSHGVADLVCLKPSWWEETPITEIILVQCKTYKGWDRQKAVIELADKLRATAIYAYREKRKLVLKELN